MGLKENSHIVRSEDSHKVVFDYVPKKFPVQLGPSGKDFVSSQEAGGSDFQISGLVANQVGIAEVNRRNAEERIRKEVLGELKEVQEKAYHEAYQLGEIEGKEKAFDETRLEMTEKLKRLDSIIASCEGLLSEVREQNENQLIQLVGRLASRIAMFEVESQPERIGQLLMDLVERVQGDQRMVIRVNQDDMVFLETLKEKLGKEDERLSQIKLESDDQIGTGGLILETNHGMIDATLETRISKAWQSLMDRAPRIKTAQIQEAAEQEPEQEHEEKEDIEEGNDE